MSKDTVGVGAQIGSHWAAVEVTGLLASRNASCSWEAITGTKAGPDWLLPIQEGGYQVGSEAKTPKSDSSSAALCPADPTSLYQVKKQAPKGEKLSHRVQSIFSFILRHVVHVCERVCVCVKV